MAPRTGLASQLGLAVETTPGLPVAPAVWLPFVSENLTQEIERIESEDIIAGRRVLASEQWDQGNITVGGDVAFEWKNRAMGKLFAAMFGEPVTTGSGPYTHVYTPKDLKPLTLQKGVPGVGGTVYPFTYAGNKVASWEIGFAAGAFATLGLTLAGMHEIGHRTVTDGVTTSGQPTITSATAAFTDNDIGKPISGTGIPAAARIASVQSATAATLSANATATGTGVALTLGMALGTASYPSPLRSFAMQRGAVSIAGQSVKVKSGTLSGDNALDEDRRFIGQQYRDEPIEDTELRTYEGSLELEFTDRTQYDRFIRASEVALQLVFRSGPDSATIDMNVRLDGETPVVGGKGVVPLNVPFKGIGATNGDADAIKVTLVNSDSAY